VHHRSTNVLGDIPGKPVLDGLHGGTIKGNIISLCMDIDIDCISGLERAKRHSIYGNCKETKFGRKICELVA
jgi:hypothetical protein